MSNEKVVRANGVDLCIETFGTFTHSGILLVHGAGTPCSPGKMSFVNGSRLAVDLSFATTVAPAAARSATRLARLDMVSATWSQMLSVC
jgi:hypothetical protein